MLTSCRLSVLILALFRNQSECAAPRSSDFTRLIQHWKGKGREQVYGTSVFAWCGLMRFTHSISTQLPYEVHVHLPVTVMTLKLREGQGSHLPQSHS